MSDSDRKTSILLYQGAVTALACWLAAILAFATHLQNPWWAAISAWVVAGRERRALLAKAANRVAGTVIGCLGGYWLALWVESRPALQMAVMFIIAAIGTYGRFRSKYSYAWTIGSVGGLMILSTSLEAPVQIYYLSLSRAAEIICGVVAATFTELILGPERRFADTASAPVELTSKAITPEPPKCSGNQ